MSLQDIGTSEIEGSHVIYTLFDLAKIITRIQPPPTKGFQTMETVYRQCESVGNSLMEYGKQIRPGLDVSLDRDLLVEGSSTVSTAVKLSKLSSFQASRTRSSLFPVYEHAVMLAYRPVFVVYAMYSEKIATTNGTGLRTPVAASPQVIQGSQKASQRAVAAARHIISIVDGFLDSNPTTRVCTPKMVFSCSSFLSVAD
jgi:hypothetical protein